MDNGRALLGLIFGRCLWSALLKLRQQLWSCLTVPAGERQRVQGFPSLALVR